MKKVLKYIGISLAIIIFLFLVAAVTIPYLYKDEIIQFATEELGKQVKADISVSHVDLTLLGDFPNISIQLHNVCAKSTNTFNKSEFASIPTDTALYAEKVLLSFNALDFLFKNYVVKQIIVRDSKVNFFLDSNSKHNWEFSIESDSTSGDMFLELSKIRFRNAQLLYYDKKLNVQANEWFDKINFAGKFRGDDFFVDVYSAFTNKDFVYENKHYFTKSVFRCNASVLRDNSKYVINKVELETPIGTIISDGSVSMLPQNEFSLDLHVNVETSIKEILKVIPQNVADSLAPYKLSANIFVEGNVNGKVTKKVMPAIVCNVACTKGNVTLQNTKYSFITKGEFKAKDIAKMSTYTYESSNTKISTGKSFAEFNTLKIHNFEKFAYAVAGSLDCTITDIDYLSKIADYDISGLAKGTFSSKGTIDDFSTFNSSFFKRINLSADLHCSNVQVSAPDNSPFNFDNVSGHLILNESNVSADSVSGKLRDESFNLHGKASDLLSYMFFDDIDTHCDIVCDIDKINVTPFYDWYESLAESSSTGEFLGTFKLKTKHLDFDPYHLDNASATVIFMKNGIEINDINAMTLRGKLNSTSVKFVDLSNNQIKCIATGEIANMSAKDIFTTFNNFNQTSVTDKQIDGTLSGKFRFASIMDSSYTPISSTIDAMADVEIKNGKAENVETLMEIGKKLKMKDEFSKVSFSTLKNIIRVQNDTLYIPSMKVQSSAFDMSFAGKHNIEDNHFSYYVTLFLKKTLSLKFHNKNKEEEDFGEIEKNNDGNFRIPLRIVGDPDHYEINYDFRKSNNVKASMEKQKSEWKEIINSGKSQEQIQEEEEKKKPIESGFQIEFD